MRSAAIEPRGFALARGVASQAADRASRNLSAEQRFLVESVRHALGCRSGGGIQSAAGLDPDWDLVVEMALKQSVAPLVYAGISSSGPLTPPPTLARLRTAYLGAMVRTDAVLEPALHRALGLLSDIGLNPVLLKGSALCYTVYPEPALRTMGDIDLLLPSADLDRAGDELKRHGFRPGSGSQAPWHHLPPLHTPDGGTAVELHDRLVPPSVPCHVDLTAAHERSEEIDAAGVRARVLGPVDTLHHACLHMSWGHRYGHFPIRALTDILAISARAGQGLDWDLLLDLSHRSRSNGAVYWPLRFSREWLGAPIPERVLCRLSPPWAVRRVLVAAASPGYVLDGAPPAGSSDEIVHRALRSLSIHGGLPLRQQVAAVLAELFPRPGKIGHLPREVTRSRFRYAAYLGRPTRMIRGAVALFRLITRSRSV